MKKQWVWLVAVVVALFAVGACGGGGGGAGKTTKLYGTTIGNGTLGDSVLVMLSPDDGSFISTIGSVGYYVNGLEYDHVSNKLYATTSNNDPVFSDGLIEIDMQTAAATTIGQAGVLINNPTVNSAGEMYAWTENTDDLLTVNTATAAAATLGPSGVGTATHGLAFDGSDNLYLVNGGIEIFTIDTVNGAATFYTDLNTTEDIAHHGDFNPTTGFYWGLGGAIPWNWSTDPSRVMIIIDMNAPAIIDSTLPTVDYLHAITFYRD